MKKILLTTLLLALLPFTTAADEGKAMIITSGAKPAQCLSSVTILEIDGQETAVHATGFELEPGVHSMNGRAEIDTTFCSAIRGNQAVTVPDLTALFDAGKTYYVGFDHSSKNRNDWKLVIWKVEGGDQ